MKITSLTIKNIGIIGDATIPIDKALILFFGEITAGKSTILKSVQWGFGGPFPQDIIKHGQREAFIQMEFAGGSIRREFYIAKDQSTKARPIVFIRDGKPVKNPVDEIGKLLNPFVQNQNHLVDMTELERKRYFAELFNVKTDDLDNEATSIESEAKDLRSKIKGYGDIDLTEVKKVDSSTLKDKLENIRASYSNSCAIINDANAKIADHNYNVARGNEKLRAVQDEIKDLEKKLRDAKISMGKITDWLDSNPKKESVGMPIPPDTSDLESQISNAAANNVRYEQYQKNLARSKERSSDEKALSDLEKRLREVRTAKVKRLADLSKTTGIEGLAFDEFGNFAFEGTSAGMLSTSQMLRLSDQLSNLYGEGFGISLLDRGESLGKSIYKLIDRAKADERTILCTVVGDKPADVSEEIGVYVVDGGKVSK